MTGKLTDEQVKAIDALTKKGAIDFLKIEINKEVSILVQPKGLYSEPEKILSVIVLPMNSNLPSNTFETADEAIAYAEHLLNQRYCWLPQQQTWIMSDVVYKFKDAGKALELAHLASLNGWDDWDDYWYTNTNHECIGEIYPDEFIEGIIIPAESPIWDAVKGFD